MAGSAQAALFTGYGSPISSDPNDILVPPPGDGNPNEGMDILELYFGQDTTNYYFRFDLEAAPSQTLSGETNFAGIYGVYIDTDNNAATGSDGIDWEYIPDAISGIEMIVDMHFDSFLGGFHDFHDHNYDGANWNTAALAASRYEANGNVLEWSVPKADLPGTFSICVATHDQGSEVATYDLACYQGLPEPATASLLLLGLLTLLRRRP